MKKLFASASYSFNNFYNNLNTQGQMVFSLIIFLILLLCVILFIAYIVENIKSKLKISKIKKSTIKYENNIESKKQEVEEIRRIRSYLQTRIRRYCKCYF